MDIQSQIIEFVEKHSLKERALASIDEVMDACIEADNEIGINFLDGNERADLIYEFGRIEFQVDKGNSNRIATRINIYSKKLYGPNFDVPVGYYEEWTNLEGEHIDEFLIFDWSAINLNIDKDIERISKTVPKRYFRRNVPEYEFATYVNHVIALFKGRQFNEVFLFIKRCLDYLEKTATKEIEKEYLTECLEMFQRIYHYIKNDELVETEKMSEYRIFERIKELCC